jgi:hypothetical protein
MGTTTARVTRGEINTLGAPGTVLGGYRSLMLTIDPPLTLEQYRDWLTETFEREGPARLWGNPIVLGDAKAHVYGCDRATWTRLDMEIRPSSIFLVAPPNKVSDLDAIADRIAASLPR